MDSCPPPQPVLCAARCVCRRAVLLEDEPGGQPATALKNDNLVVVYKRNELLFIKRHCVVIGSNMVTGF